MSWDQLHSILKNAREEARQLDAEPPVACPNDGTPLLTDAHGNLRCPFDGWTYN